MKFRYISKVFLISETIYLFFQPSLMDKTFQFVTCTKIADEYYLQLDSNFKCSQRSQILRDNIFLFTYNFTLIFLIPLLFAVSLFYGKFKNKFNNIETRNLNNMITIYFHIDYEKHAYMWSFILLVQRMCFILIIRYF